VERALKDGRIQPKMRTLAVGLAADCDAPEPLVADLMNTNLAGATSLPLVAFLTPDGRFIEGYSGWMDEPEFVQLLARVEKSPLLDAAPAVRKVLAKHAAAVGPAVEKGDWQVVLVAAREAKKSIGRCPERAAIQAAAKQARAWAAAELARVVEEAPTATDLAGLRKVLAGVRQKFAGEPEAADADNGGKALQQLAQVRQAEAGGNPARGLRERQAAPFQGTRWTAVFAKPATGTEAK
jgi:hypothetical protein